MTLECHSEAFPKSINFWVNNKGAMLVSSKHHHHHHHHHSDKYKDCEAMFPTLLPLEEQKKLSGVAVDAVLDSVSVATTYQDMLKEAGVIFCPISEAVQKYPDLVQKYLGSVVPYSDNFYATLNSAVFSDGSF